MRGVAFAVPGDLATPTGGYAYDRRIIAELECLGWDVSMSSVWATAFRSRASEQREFAQARLRPFRRRVRSSSMGSLMAFLPNRRTACSRNPLIALVHHPLALETGLSALQADAIARQRTRCLGLRTARHRDQRGDCAASGADYGVAPDRITVVLPGTDRAASARRSNDGIVRLLSVGALVPRKGFDVLIAALATLADLPWHLTVRRRPHARSGCAPRNSTPISRDTRLGDRIAVLGAVSPERIAELYASSDLFVLASRFEGYGMAFAEALAHGLPVIGTTAGAIPETVPQGAGMLVPPDDAQAMATALRRLIENPAARHEMCARARGACASLQSWPDSAKLFAQAIEGAS